MADDDTKSNDEQQPPEPEPDVKRLDRLVGTWKVSGGAQGTIRYEWMEGGFKVGLDAMEGLRRQWTVELGPHGIRAVTLKTGSVPESIPDDVEYRDEIAAATEEATLLGREATLDDVRDVAAFVASERARTITATEVNISCGAITE